MHLHNVIRNTLFGLSLGKGIFMGIETIGTRIADCRKKRGLTQFDLAEELCTKKSTVSSYENDKIDIKISILQDIARILGTTVSYLVDGDSIDAEVEEAVKLLMKIANTKIRKAAIEQIRVLATI